MTRKQIKDARKILFTVANRIANHPEQYKQTSWCGTACCIAGHIVTSNPNAKYVFSSNFIYGRKDYFVPNLAIKLLHLNTKNVKDREVIAQLASTVFTAHPEIRWPQPYSKNWTRAKNDKDRADVAVAFIREHVIPNYFPLKDEKKK